MTFIQKQAQGFYFSLLAIVSAIVGIICYFINCNTAYFSNLGINNFEILYIVVAIVLELIFIIGSELKMSSVIIDILPILISICFVLAVVIFISTRIYGMASILTFEKNAQTMSDLSSAVTGIVFSVIALVLSIMSSFFRVIK